jgi:hypothetical protein
LRDVAQGDKGVTFTRRVGFLIVSMSLAAVEAAYSSEEGIDKLGSIWDEMLVILEDGVDCKDGVLPDIGMSVFLLISSHFAIIGATHQT